jgi:hypothetical protein
MLWEIGWGGSGVKLGKTEQIDKIQQRECPIVGDSRHLTDAGLEGWFGARLNSFVTGDVW